MHLGATNQGLIRIPAISACLLTVLFTVSGTSFAQVEKAADPAPMPKSVITSTNSAVPSPMSDTGDLATRLFVEDRITLEFMAGAMFSPCGVGPRVPVYNYQQDNIRLGWMLDSPNSWGPCADIDSPLRGNFEAIFEVTGSSVWYSFGNYMVGATTLVRYNFVQPDWIVVPYFQCGSGITPQCAGGLRFLIDDNFTFNMECAFQHISNAGTSARNLGVNAVGGFAGFTYYFDKIWSD
ncbi:MAG: acyloxyacyl hydrolase [Verrucomicrobia bacterium]|nr:acyloxyacyl hydrolase [Verrucomicrobiota bacterium]